MSRLRELRLHGFKTFADPTRFVFEPGVNAVIGPNGSGKSNMADAVRWVLGEQSNRSLRTRRADDVIFAGSQERRPQGMAEAILTLDNADGWLPIEFGEVSIGRRAYRSGESEYLINGARARLRDVVDLLGEGRLGANELVVVGQGTVDAALSLRPEERRQLFEEAAGVKGLQVRKNEALARLARARDNLTRVTDLIAELRPQVRRLALQAQHQQEHESLGQRARALVLESHRRRERAAAARLGEARRQAAAAEAALEEHRTAESANREALRAAEERYWAAEAGGRAAAERREATRERRLRAESRVDALSSRAGELERAAETAVRDLADAEARLAAHASGEPDRQLDPALAAATAAEEAWRAASDALAAADAELVRAEESLAEARRRQGSLIAERARSGELAARLAARREQAQRELDGASAGIREAGAALEGSERGVEQAERALADALAERGTAIDALAVAQPQADEARRRASELAERVGGMRGELEALHERAVHGAGLGSLLTAAGWPALLDSLSAPEEAWPAIEAVVGGELEQALVWRDGDLIERLGEARGAARLLATRAAQDEEPGSAAGDRTRALEAVGAERTLADWVGPGSHPRLFEVVAVAPDLAALLRGWRSLPAGWMAVTLQGDMADGRGVVSVRGRGETRGGEAARRHARRRELADAVERMETEQAAAAEAAARGMAAVSDAARRLELARARVDAAERQLADARNRRDALEARRRRDEERAAELRAELSGLLAESARTESAVSGDVPEEAVEELADLERRAAAARAAREKAGAGRDEARVAWQAAQVAARGLEQQVAGRQRELAMLGARQVQLRESIAASRAALEQLRTELAAAQAELDTAVTEDEAAAAARSAAERQREEERAALLDLERTAGGGAERLAQLERDLHAAAVEVSRQEEALASLGRERELALESLATDALDADGIQQAPPPVGVELAEELGAMDDEALDAELRRVRRTIGQIGSVNPFAVEEHRELSARLEELSGQDADLSSAIGSTEQLIARLDADITDRFNAAFAAIGERFDEFCRLLFAGGSASLQLGEGGDGEAPGGIEIVVRPPGKRLQRLAMLSGGERALTGVALLFAMLSVNPVPFCILDEVDAALDEANIGRFADALRKLSETIDFVVITHNRATIEVADTIYGVTMTDAAVSKIVSLRLADLPAEATVR